ncbi:transporter (NhaC family) [Mangrovibacterium marinum]|uniref:Transporter (NhaC family) n=1 Tax=Mangrovibacterium marinum TaxID=1639118 RepID=A0A2T5C4G1_9BACT|nr:Na+/H+ antiporter NhaC [Mangrovibacterium marinum]PTN09755.1 transporter (NhaC family) [Mangrovibacterium marinum]
MKREPLFLEALLPILLLIVLLTLNVIFFDDTLAGANQVALLLAATIGGIIVRRNGQKWDDTMDNVVKTIGSAMPSMLILLLIGSLAGTWMLSGIVPTLIYYGLDIINPQVFLVTAVVVSAIVSVATGSSWSTIATIGVALIGIGKAIGINEAIVAGAIISGAYFGDKISPLSDTTNLAPAMAGTDLFTHIRYMFYTTTPSFILTLLIFLMIGLNYDFCGAVVDVANVKSAIDGAFNTSPWLFLVPVVLFVIIVKKVPPVPSLMIGTLLGALFAIIFQPHIIQELAGNVSSYVEASYISGMQAMFGDIAIQTPDADVNELLQTSGMGGMLDTIWLILSAMVFGGIMESGGLLASITRPIIRWANSTGSLVASTVVTCIFFNATASDQYISIVVPGRMYRKTFRDKGLKPEVLSRTLEDSGTMTSVLIPWNTCGATQSRVLGVGTFDYLPYAFFNLISPLMSILFAYLNLKIRRYKVEEVPVADE